MACQQVGAEVEQLLGTVRRQLSAAPAANPAETAKLLRALDAKLSAVEASVGGTGTLCTTLVCQHR
jgi:hypothetical protein